MKRNVTVTSHIPNVTLHRLAELNLAPEQFKEVLSIVEELQSVIARKKEAGRRRTAAWRKRKCDVTPKNSPSYIDSPPSTDSQESKEVVVEGRGEKKKPRQPKGVMKPLPDDWRPNDAHAALCQELGVPLYQVEEVFRDSCAAKGRMYVDHDAGFRTYIRNFNKFNGAAGTHRERKAEAWDDARAALRQSIERDQGKAGHQPTLRLLSITTGK